MDTQTKFAIDSFAENNHLKAIIQIRKIHQENIDRVKNDPNNVFKGLHEGCPHTIHAVKLMKESKKIVSYCNKFLS